MMKSSDRRVAANRANAARSTGPRTAAGKAAASRNSVRHGLSMPVVFAGNLPPRLEELAQALAAERENLLPLAREAAECRYNLERLLDAKRALMRRRLADLRETLPQENEADLAARAAAETAEDRRKLEGYERRQRSRWRKYLN